MTIAGKRLDIRLVIAVVTIILVVLAAKMLFFSGDEEVSAPAATQKAQAPSDRGDAKVEAGDPAAETADATAVPAMPDAQFERALRNLSTGPNYVLVTIVDNSKDSAPRAQVCVEAVPLLMMLQREHGFTHADGQWEQVIQFALAQRDRTYEFSKRAPERRYTDEMLEEVRRFLAHKDEAEIRALVNDQQSDLYKLCAKKPGSLPRYFPAVGHVLCERGILCGRGCKPGLLYIDK